MKKGGLLPVDPQHLGPFNRAIGKWAGQKYHPQTGTRLEDKEYAQQLGEWLPKAEDKKRLIEIIQNEKNWILPKEGGRDPLATIGEPRKSALNATN